MSATKPWHPIGRYVKSYDQSRAVQAPGQYQQETFARLGDEQLVVIWAVALLSEPRLRH